jgi:hypothetical protein
MPERPKEASQPESANQPGWQFSEEAGPAAAPAPRARNQGTSWRASEYIPHHRGFTWFLVLTFGIAGASALVFLLTRDIASTAAVAVVGVCFGVFALRQPQILDYTVDRTGVYIGQKFYPYNLFRSFSLLEEDAMPSVLFMPQHKFGLPITIYFALEDEKKIVEIIGSHLPHEERSVPPVDRLMSKIRF